MSNEDKNRSLLKRESSEPLVSLACHVCGDKAGKHSYYGGQACVSCRAFFRRAVQTDLNLAYSCVKDKQCDIYLRARKSCQYCRYRLSGMLGWRDEDYMGSQ